MKILIVEDETAAFENLVHMLSELDSEIQIVGNTESIRQTIHWLQSNPLPDLILMDIHLSDGSSFSVFDNVEVEIPVIFTTAYDQYAIEAFKVNSIDYLLKPIKNEDLNRALSKFKKWTKTDTNKYVEQIAQFVPVPQYQDKLLIPYRESLIPISLSDISFFYCSDKNCRIYLIDQRIYSYSKSLEQIEKTIDPKGFFRANKQFIVCRNAVENISVCLDSRLLLTLKIETPEKPYVSKNKASNFKAWFLKDK
ncbi:MAG: LytTR family DNA-binding domain-containing protein [Paludibacter sp.]